MSHENSNTNNRTLDLVLISGKLVSKAFTYQIREEISDHQLVWYEWVGELDTTKTDRLDKVPDYIRSLDESVLDNLYHHLIVSVNKVNVH